MRVRLNCRSGVKRVSFNQSTGSTRHSASAEDKEFRSVPFTEPEHEINTTPFVPFPTENTIDLLKKSHSSGSDKSNNQ